MEATRTPSHPHRNGVVRRTPLVLPDTETVLEALQAMDRAGQAIALVTGPHGLLGLVTFEDLGFAWDWAGPAAVVSDAMTMGVVEVGCGSTHHDAAEAFAAALRAWTRDVATF